MNAQVNGYTSGVTAVLLSGVCEERRDSKRGCDVFREFCHWSMPSLAGLFPWNVHIVLTPKLSVATCINVLPGEITLVLITEPINRSFTSEAYTTVEASTTAAEIAAMATTTETAIIHTVQKRKG